MKVCLQLKGTLIFFGVMLISAVLSLSILSFVFRPIMKENSETQILSAANSAKQLMNKDIQPEEIRSILSVSPLVIEKVEENSKEIQDHMNELKTNNYYSETSGIFPKTIAYLDLGNYFISITASTWDNNYWIFYFIIILAFIICTVAGTLITIFISRAILKPVRELSLASAQVAKGNFKVRVKERGDREYVALIVNFNRMVEELSGTETLRGDFISNVSHEFKTPLASIQGFAKLLQNENLAPADRREYTQIIIDETTRLTKLATNILNLSKLENQKTISNKVRFSLDEQIRKIIVMLEPEWSKKNIDMDVALDDVSYFGNEDLMGQIWQNIINNAIKFTPENGLISVHLFRTESNITVRISDNGDPIPNDVKDKIFEKFYQGDHSRKTEGNGLGLALVKRIIDLCNGKISVENLYEGGVCFIVELPFVIADML